MAHAQDGKYPSPYAADAAAHGKDIPLWAKIKEGKFKKGKYNLAKLTVPRPVVHPVWRVSVLQDFHMVASVHTLCLMG